MGSQLCTPSEQWVMVRENAGWIAFQKTKYAIKDAMYAINIHEPIGKATNMSLKYNFTEQKVQRWEYASPRNYI